MFIHAILWYMSDGDCITGKKEVSCASSLISPLGYLTMYCCWYEKKLDIENDVLITKYSEKNLSAPIRSRT